MLYVFCTVWNKMPNQIIYHHDKSLFEVNLG